MLHDRPVIYMYLETLGQFIKMDSPEEFHEAVEYCDLYFQKNPHDYLIWCYGKWFVYEPECSSVIRVA